MKLPSPPLVASLRRWQSERAQSDAHTDAIFQLSFFDISIFSLILLFRYFRFRYFIMLRLHYFRDAEHTDFHCRLRFRHAWLIRLSPDFRVPPSSMLTVPLSMRAAIIFMPVGVPRRQQ